jgi:hypothetical protein
MVMTLLKWMSAGTFAGSLYYSPSRYCAALLLAVWAIAIVVFVHSNLAEKFLWVPVLLGLAGVFGSIVVLVLPANITLTVDLATLVLFVAAVDALKKRRPLLALIKHRAR